MPAKHLMGAEPSAQHSPYSYCMHHMHKCSPSKRTVRSGVPRTMTLCTQTHRGCTAGLGPQATTCCALEPVIASGLPTFALTGLGAHRHAHLPPACPPASHCPRCRIPIRFVCCPNIHIFIIIIIAPHPAVIVLHLSACYCCCCC